MGKIQRRKMVKHTKKRGKFLFFSYPLLLDSPFRHRPRRQPGSRSPPITPGWAKSIFSSILGAILALRSQRGAQKVLPSPALLFLQIDLFVKTKRKFKERRSRVTCDDPTRGGPLMKEKKCRGLQFEARPLAETGQCHKERKRRSGNNYCPPKNARSTICGFFLGFF